MHKLSIDKINQLINDKYRPMYHFASPATNCHPGDANGSICDLTICAISTTNEY